MKKRGLIGLLILLVIFPLVSAATCPPELGDGWICDDGNTEIYIGNGLSCSYEGYQSVWETFQGAEYPTFYSGGTVYSCEDPDNFNGGIACCGQDAICAEADVTPSLLPPPFGPGTSTKVCVASDAQFCSDLDEDTCESAATSYIVENSIELMPGYDSGYCGRYDILAQSENPVNAEDNATCWEESNCGCNWNSAEGKCTVLVENQTQCTDGTNTSNSLCELTITEIDNCDIDGSIIIKWAPVTSENDPNCVGKEIPIPCSSVMKLGFFTKMNFIVAVLGLLLIYSLIIIKNKE
jgi:hypothetical protein